MGISRAVELGSDDARTGTNLMPTCLTATPVEGTCLTALRIPSNPELSLFLVVDDVETPITFEEIVELAVGTHTFLIRNTGEGTLELGTITVDDETFIVTQPADVSLSANESTTFTVEIPLGGGGPPV